MSAEILPVSPEITCIRRASYLTCSYLVRVADGVVLVDAGMKSDGADVFAALDALRMPVSEVKAILLTHWHNDHAAGAAALAEASGARVYASAREAPWLRRETATEGLGGWLSDAIPEAGPLVLAKGLLGSAPMRAVQPTDLVGDGDVVRGFRVIDTPGHTDGHLAFLHEATGALFTGDALALIDGQLRFMSRPVTPDLAEARRSMQKLLRLPFSLVCPGHRAPGPVNAHDRAEFERRLESEDWPMFG